MHVRSIVRVLLIATLAVGASTAYADDAPVKNDAVEVVVDAQQADIVEVSQPTSTCVSQDVVTQYETRVESLERERKSWETQMVTASRKWQQEKSDLETKIAEERVLQMAAAAEMTNVQKEASIKVKTIEQQLEESRTHHARQLGALQSKVSALEKTVEELKAKLADQETTLGLKDTEVSDARLKLAKYVDQVKSLERDVAKSHEKNDALLLELSKAEERLTIAALLSSYYDEGVVLADSAVSALRAQVESLQQGSTGISQPLETLETYTKSATELTEKLYKEHLAATVDPILADVRVAADPYVKRFKPLAEAELLRAQKTATKWYKEGLRRGRATRADAIAVLKQHDVVAPYAQKIVDAGLVVLLAPFAIIAFRIVLSLVWFVVRTSLCIATCGLCCSGRKRSKSKRKISRKQQLSAAAQAAAAADATPTTSTAKKPASSSPGKRNNTKKK